mgnify:FL=1
MLDRGLIGMFYSNVLRKSRLCLLASVLCLLALTIYGYANERILLYEDFSEGIDPNYWSPAYLAYPFPEVEDDGTGNKVAYFSYSSMQGGDLNWTDYEAEVKFKLTPNAGNDWFRFELNVRCPEDSAGTYVMRMQYGGGSKIYFAIYKGSVRLDSVTFSDTTPLEKFGTDWHTFTVRAVGDTLSGYLDGEKMVSAVLPDIEPNGRIRLTWRKNTAGAARHGVIDYIKVTDLSH